MFESQFGATACCVVLFIEFHFVFGAHAALVLEFLLLLFLEGGYCGGHSGGWAVGFVSWRFWVGLILSFSANFIYLW